MRKGLFNWFIPTVRFNLHYFPFRQAVKLPVYVFDARFLVTKGSVTLPQGEISRAMIKIGMPETGLCRGRKFTLEIKGKVKFNGPCRLGAGGVLSVGDKGLAEFGSNVVVSDASKVIAYHYIYFGDNTTAGWECSFCDSDFHAMKNAFTGKKLKAYAPIKIGHDNWFGCGCHILKGCVTPAYTTISAGSVLTRKYKCEEKSIISGNPAEVVSEGCFYRDMSDDRFEYKPYEQIPK